MDGSQMQHRASVWTKGVPVPAPILELEVHRDHQEILVE